MSRALSYTLKNNKKLLQLTLPGSHKNLLLTPIALLDSCRCPHCFHSETNQRAANPFLNESKSPQWKNWHIDSVRVLHEGSSSLSLECTVNGHKVLYELPTQPGSPRPEPFLWNAQSLVQQLQREAGDSSSVSDSECEVLPRVDASTLHTRSTRAQWISNLLKYGFCMLDNVDPSNDQNTYDLVKHIGYYKNSLFGEHWSFENKMDFKDTAYTNQTIEPHSDNTYFTDPTRIFFLHCVEYNATGGLSTMTDSFNLVRQLKNDHPEAFECLAQTPVLFHYKDDKHHYVHKAPIIELDPWESDKILRVRYNHHDRFHVHHLNEEQQNQFFEAYNILCKYVHDEKNSSSFLLKPGSVLSFDNWRVLHGRREFEGERRCVGFYSMHDDFMSTARLLFGDGEEFVGPSVKLEEESI